MNPYKDAYPNLSKEERAEKGIGPGVVEEGAYADLLVIKGNPLEFMMLVAMPLGKLIPVNTIGEVDMLYHMRRKK